MNITITGNLGSGKSSVCRQLEQAGFTIISAGDIFRQIADEKGMTVLELNEAAKTDRSIDDMLDERSTQLGRQMDHTVFDSRLAWNFVENSFKVFLLADLQEAARRVFEGVSRSAESYQNPEQAREGLKARAQLEQERFQKLYGIDYYDASNYDLIIESTYATPEQIAQEIQRNFDIYQKQPFCTKAELNLKCLYPCKGQMLPEEPADAAVTEESASLCAAGTFGIIEKNGYHYVYEGCERVAAAIAAGKIFAQAADIRTDGQAQKLVGELTQADIDRFEQAGRFHYLYHPVQLPQKAGYTVNFSKIF